MGKHRHFQTGDILFQSDFPASRDFFILGGAGKCLYNYNLSILPCPFLLYFSC
ncbi:hypothetical protein CLS_05750 [[Clostridium] cf. saccharolyticum K10]|nr:hypothetical protein CLS_05750 [[Clostridium] cf. saccharolyticum K10]